MTMPANELTPERIAELRGMKEAATAGNVSTDHQADLLPAICADNELGTVLLAAGEALIEGETEEMRHALVDFVAALLTDAPALLAAAEENTRLRAALTEIADHLYEKQDMARCREMAKDVLEAKP